MRAQAGKKEKKADHGECVASGNYARVILFGQALDEFKKLVQRAEQNSDPQSVRQEQTLRRYFERFADVGPKSLGRKMYKPQERIMVGNGQSVFIFEFKAYQFRLYGAEATFEGQRTFIGAACDPAKKKDKADRALLRKAAENVSQIKDGSK